MAKVTINFFGKQKTVSVDFSNYQNGRIAVWSSVGTLSTNLPDVVMGENEFAAKTYSENVGWAQEVLDKMPEVFEWTGRFATSGFIQAPIYRVKK